MDDLPEYPTQWGLEAVRRIDESFTLRAALIVTASHLSELIDQLVPVMEPHGMLETQYRQFCCLRKAECVLDGSEIAEEYRLVWENAEDIFSIYDQLPSMTDLEVELGCIERFVPDFDLEIEKEEAVRNLFTNVIAYLEGAKDAELADKTPRILRQMTFKGPGFDIESYFPYHWTWYLPPEPQYPESLEELDAWIKGING